MGKRKGIIRLICRPRLFLLAFCLLPFASSSVSAADQPSRTVTLAEALQLLETQNPDALAAGLQVAEAEAEKVAARVYPNPLLSGDTANIAAGRTNPPGLSVGQTIATTVRVDQLFVLWGKRHLRIESAETGIASAKEQRRDALRLLQAAVKDTFYRCLHDQRQLAFAEDNREHYQQVVALNERRFHSGDISEAEFRKIALEQLKYISQVEDARRALAESQQLLGRLLGIGGAVAATGDLAAPAIAVRTDNALETAMENRPDWAALQRARERAELELQLARRERYPDVTLGTDYTNSQFAAGGNIRNTLGFGFSVPVPVLNQNQGEIAKAEVALRQTENDQARLRLDVAQEVQTAVASYESTQRLRQTFESGYLDDAKVTLAAAEASYRAGAASLIELLDAERTYTATQTDYLDALFASQSSLVALEKALGKDYASD
jgi:cobalt-zinc-cadmium efflux system outer membrane protein